MAMGMSAVIECNRNIVTMVTRVTTVTNIGKKLKDQLAERRMMAGRHSTDSPGSGLCTFSLVC